jgi:hypothetical protein
VLITRNANTFCFTGKVFKCPLPRMAISPESGLSILKYALAMK